MSTAPTAPALPTDLTAACANAQLAFEAFLGTNPAIDKLLGETIRVSGVTLRAAGAALFMTDSPDRPELAIEHNLAALHMLAAGKPLPGTLVAVRRTAREIKPLIVPPFFIDAEAGDLPVNPSACQLLFVPMKLHGKAAMVLIVAVAPTMDAQEHRVQITFLQRLLAQLESTLTQRQMTLIEQGRGEHSRLTQFSEQVHRHLLLAEVAADIANLARDVLGADRVTVELRPKARKKILAVSNVDEASTRAALFQAQRLVLEYVRERGIPAALDRAAAAQLVSDPHLQEAGAAYFAAADFAAFAAAPIKTDRGDISGVILAEFRLADAAALKPGLLADLARISAGSVANATAYEAIPLRRTLSAAASLYRKPFSTRRAVVAAVSLAVILVLAALAFIPADFSIKADCTIQPVSQLNIVAPLPGQIIDVPVRAGEHVYPRSNPAAKPLFVFDTTDLQAERAGRQQKEAELTGQLKDLQEKGDIAKIGGVQSQLRQAASEIALLDHRIAQATVYSPIEGTVLTENVEQKKWATVQAGEPLMEIASFKDWVLTIDVPETQVTAVRDALAASPGGVEIEYILYPWPDRRFAVHAKGVATLLPASAQAKNANVFRLQVGISPRDLPEGIAMSGVTGRAKLHVGEKPLLAQWTSGLTRLVKMTLF